MALSVEDQIRHLQRSCQRILTVEDLATKLRRGKALRIKMGMDPTAPDVTLGHAVPLRIIRQFQEWGHKAVVIIGDYTARVGDPSGRDATRPILAPEQIDANAKTYVAQIGKILLSDPEHLEVRWNSEWLAKLDLLEIIRLAGRKSVAQMLEREAFAERFAKGVDIRLHELLYPLLQGWDSVVIKADVEMGGSDQLFNNLVGREFQKEEGQDPQVVMVTPLLVGTDGTLKMSKSKGNYIGVTDPPGGPRGMFGKMMSLPDALMESYYALLTDVPADDYTAAIKANPRQTKARLAEIIVTWLHNPAAATAAAQEFQRVIVEHAPPEDMPELHVGAGMALAEVLVKAALVKSSSEARQKLREGAVRINGAKMSDHNFVVTPPAVVQLGNRKFVKVVS